MFTVTIRVQGRADGFVVSTRMFATLAAAEAYCQQLEDQGLYVGTISKVAGR